MRGSRVLRDWWCGPPALVPRGGSQPRAGPALSWTCGSRARGRNVLICISLPIPFLLRHRSPSHRASGPSPLFRTCLTNLLSLSNIGAAWVSTLESVAPRCPLSLAAQTPGPDGPEPGGMAADGGVEDIRKKRNGQDSFFFNKHLTLHQETPTQYSLSARSASGAPRQLAGEDGMHSHLWALYRTSPGQGAELETGTTAQPSPNPLPFGTQKDTRTAWHQGTALLETVSCPTLAPLLGEKEGRGSRHPPNSTHPIPKRKSQLRPRTAALPASASERRCCKSGQAK